MTTIRNVDPRRPVCRAVHWRSTLLLALCAGIAPDALADQVGPKLEVEVTGFRNNVGRAGISVFKSASGFPSETARAVARMGGAIKDGNFVASFSGLPAGRYAVAVVHDENENQKLDKNLFGMPTEGWGVSNNVRPSLRAPKFDEAVFKLLPVGGKVRVQIGY